MSLRPSLRFVCFAALIAFCALNSRAQSAPSITSVSPGQGPVGTSITITGQNFGATQGSSTVTFAGVAAVITTWTNTQIVAQIASGTPTGATNVYVTTSAGSSNGIYFVVTGPSITSLSPTSGSVGRSVTIMGTGFGTSQGTSTVKFNGVAATSFPTWTTTSITAVVPSGATTGNVVVTVGAVASNGVNFTVIAPPAITASVFPPVNTSGWITTNAYVTFFCTQGGLPIATCPAQQVVSTDGASQVYSGTVTDTGGNSATASVTLNVERTPPAIAVSSPTDQTVVTTGTVSVSGTTTNSVTTINSVTCNGATAATTSGAFSCNLSLNPGVNLVMVRATDLAGNISAVRLHVSYATALPAPASLQIGPASANVLVGGTQQFTAVDQLGRPRSDATWTVDNTSIATITTDSSPTLTGVAAGTATLTANVGGISAQIQVNVLAGTSFPVGTVLWSAPTTTGFAVVQIAQAVPTSNGPDLYSVESGSNNSSLIRALTSDGRPMWTTQVSGNAQRGLSATPDGSGGLVVHITPQTGLDRFIDLDGQSGATVWEYDDGVALAGRKLAVGTDGTIYLREATFSTTVTPGSTVEQLSLIGLDPSAGSTRFLYPVPLSTLTNNGTTAVPDYRVGPVSAASDPIIGPDGSVSAELLVVHSVANGAYNQTLSLLQSVPGGASALTTIAEVDWSGTGTISFISPVGQIPDGSGEAFASWFTSMNGTSTTVNHISHITSSGVTDLTPSFQSQILPNGMVLGESGTLFATDGSSVLSLSSSLSVNWTYSALTPNLLTILTSVAGGGVAIKSTDTNGTDTVVRLDTNGLTTIDSWSARYVDYYSGNIFTGIASMSSLAEFSAMDPQEAAAQSSRPLGDAQHNGTVDPALVLVATQDCHKSNQSGSLFARYPTYKLRLPSNTSSLPAENYTVFEYVKEDPSADNCTLGFGHVNPCRYADGSTSFPYNDFSDEISSGLSGEEFIRTQFFLYGLPKQRMFFIKKIYRTLPDRSLSSKSPIFNKIHAVPSQDPLIDGHPDPWFAPWDGTAASCDSSNSLYFP